MGIFLESNIGKVSGQVVYLASGFNTVSAVVSLSGVTSDVSGRTVWLADTSGGGLQTFAVGGERFLRVSISGQPVTANVSVAANVSGNQIRFTPGFNDVQISGQTITAIVSNLSGINTLANAFDPSGNAWRNLWVNQSGGNRLLVDIGQSIQVSGQTVVSQISGQTIVVGGTVTIAGAVTTSVSGNLVNTSISGNVVDISNQVVNISGQPVRAETSGQSQRIQAFDPSGNVWRDLWVNQSGGNKLSVDATISTQTNVSGQVVVSEISGQTIIARISGQTVTVAGGVTVSGNVINTSISGNFVDISGSLIRLQGFDPSGQIWRNLTVHGSGGDQLKTRSTLGAIESGVILAAEISGSFNARVSGEKIRLQGFDPSGNTWRDLYVNQSGGNILKVDTTVNAVTNVSGQVVVAEISGQTIIAQISGQSIRTTSGSNLVQISGQAVSISGQRVEAELKAQNSGDGTLTNLTTTRPGGSALLVGTEIPSNHKSYATLYATAASGGTALTAFACKRVTLRNISTFSGRFVLVGFSGNLNAPWVASVGSGRGFYLRDGDGLTLEVENASFVRVVSLVSGVPISYISVGDV